LELSEGGGTACKYKPDPKGEEYDEYESMNIIVKMYLKILSLIGVYSFTKEKIIQINIEICIQQSFKVIWNCSKEVVVFGSTYRTLNHKRNACILLYE
jgi:hypothetical protein